MRILPSSIGLNSSFYASECYDKHAYSSQPCIGGINGLWNFSRSQNIPTSSVGLYWLFFCFIKLDEQKFKRIYIWIKTAKESEDKKSFTLNNFRRWSEWVKFLTLSATVYLPFWIRAVLLFFFLLIFCHSAYGDSTASCWFVIIFLLWELLGAWDTFYCCSCRTRELYCRSFLSLLKRYCQLQIDFYVYYWATANWQDLNMQIHRFSAHIPWHYRQTVITILMTFHFCT